MPGALSSVGRAPARQAGGHWFEPSSAHRPGGLAVRTPCQQSRLAASWSGPMQPCWPFASPRWRSGRRRWRSAGVRRWSWLAPAVGPGSALRDLLGDGAVAGRGGDLGDRGRWLLVACLPRLSVGRGWRAGERRWPSAARSRLLALLAAALPFVAEGHFGILGTSFNPDMSQHLLATDRLADGALSQLLRPGLPAGPARRRRRARQRPRRRPGPGLRRPDDRRRRARLAHRARPPSREQPPQLPHPRARSSSASPTWSPPTSPRAPSRRRCRPSSSSPSSSPCARRSRNPDWRELPLRFVPAALIAVGVRLRLQLPRPHLAGRRAPSGRPSSLWTDLAGGVDAGGRDARPAAAPRIRAPRPASPSPSPRRRPDRPRDRPDDRLPAASRPSTPTAPASATSSARSRPSRRSGSGPRATSASRPGDGAVPALGYYLGARLRLDPARSTGCPLLAPARDGARSPASPPRRSSTPRPASAARPTRPPRRSRSAAPLAALVILLPLLRRPVAWPLPARRGGLLAARPRQRPGRADLLLAGADRPAADVGDGSTLVLASDASCSPRNTATRYIVWELRGGRVCIERRASEAGSGRPPPGVRFVITEVGDGPARRSPACACAVAPALRPLGDDGRARGHERLPADRRPPGPPGPGCRD